MYARPDSQKNVVAYCQEKGIAFMASKCLGGLDARDGRRDLRADFPDLAAMADAKGVSAHALCVAYYRHRYPHMLLIPGTRTVAHAEDVAAARDVRFTEAELAAVDGMRKKRKKAPGA